MQQQQWGPATPQTPATPTAPQPPRQRVEVTVIAARNMPKSSGGVLTKDKTDPYFEIQIAKDAQVTDVKKDAGSNATWNQLLTFSGDSAVSATTVFVTLYDSDSDPSGKRPTLSDDKLGSATVPLSNSEGWHSINSSGKSVGEVHLRIKIVK
eukprot:TRINITY_DN1289_c0_g1_i4.p2 TRINITY_DN1289_c0_g1~~TRINITY_DN1289_c0_g1_i4.p2  ORF type:complete len:152 (-),score=33.65 TRINITY_DN1289_c0_g1_i4:5-460(-)